MNTAPCDERKMKHISKGNILKKTDVDGGKSVYGQKIRLHRSDWIRLIALLQKLENDEK
jgi:hypothetical protein